MEYTNLNGKYSQKSVWKLFLLLKKPKKNRLDYAFIFLIIYL